MSVGPQGPRRVSSAALSVTTALVYAFLYLPVVILVVFSFNGGRTGARWEGFSTEWYVALADNDRLIEATLNSLYVAVISTTIAVVIGTMLSLALERHRFRGRATVRTIAYLPVIAPEIVTGVSLLAFFSLVLAGLNDLLGRTSVDALRLGRPTIIVAHAAFNIAFVALVVRVSLRHLDPAVEEAAQDLGAPPWGTFWRVTLPLIAPGIAAGALLGFALSLDNFVITLFVTGPGSATLPIEVFGQLRRTIRPDVNAVSTLIFAASSAALLGALTVQWAAARRFRDPSAEREGRSTRPPANDREALEVRSP